ncbi:hypothetical protein VTO73DRAFT_10690 [Trametes versicolor]
MSHFNDPHALEADSTICRTSVTICTMLGPSEEPVYILSESALLDAIKEGRLPLVHGCFQHPRTAPRHDGGLLDALHHYTIIPEATYAGAFPTTDAPDNGNRLATVENPHMGDVALGKEQPTGSAKDLQIGTSRRARRAACEHCYQARKRCGCQRPCSRCTRMRLPCAPRSHRPREPRTVRLLEEDTTSRDPPFLSETAGRWSRPSGASDLQGEQKNADSRVSQTGCFPTWCPGLSWHDGAAYDTLQAGVWQQSTSAQAPSAPSSSSMRTEDLARPAFGPTRDSKPSLFFARLSDTLPSSIHPGASKDFIPARTRWRRGFTIRLQ